MIENIINFGTLLGTLFLGTFVYIKNRKAQVNRFFFLYALALAGWIVTLLLFYNSSNGNVLFRGRLNFAIASLIPFFGFYFGYYFPKKTFEINKFLKIALCFWAILLFIITLFTDFIDKEEIILNNEITTKFGALYPLYMLYFVPMVLSTFIIPLLKYKKSNYQQKQQIKYLTAGISISLIFGIITNILLPSIFKYYELQLIGPIGLSFFLYFTSYAIIKHQLLNINIIIQRSLLYTTLLGTTVGVLLTINFIIGFFLHDESGNYLLSAILTTIIGIFGAPHLERYFQKITDPIFFKDKYDFREVMKDLSQTLNQNIKLEALLVEITKLLKLILRTNNIVIWLSEREVAIDAYLKLRLPKESAPKDIIRAASNYIKSYIIHSDLDRLIQNAGGQEMKKFLAHLKDLGERNRFSLYLSLKSSDKLVGAIFFGEKISGDQYTKEDINLLTTFSHQAAVALEKSQLYEKVENYSKDLEKEVAKRTEKIKSLQENQKNLMIDVSHNLQTPLTVIKCELELLEKEFPNNANLLKFGKSIDKLSHFIYDLLRLAQLDSGKIRLNRKKYDLSRQLFDLAEYYQTMLDEKNIKVETEIEKGLWISADEEKIEETITNIISNAYKYIGENKIVSIGARSRKNLIEIRLKDNGPGIEPEDMPKLFNRFFRTAAADGVKGNGLGLSFCRKIIELHGGEIKAESKLGKGTEFVIKLPRE